MMRTSLLIFLALTLVTVGCTRGDLPIAPDEERTMSATTFAADAKDYPSALGLFPDYRLVPGDVLDVLFQIRTWQSKEEFRLAVDDTVTVKFVHAPELNETQNIQPDGRISLPYLGEVRIAGMSVGEVTSMLRERYASILRAPEIYVVVPEYRSRIKELKNDLHTASRGLSRLVTVRPDGFCTFPLAGDIFVAGRTIPQINEELDAIYEDYLPGLHVDLFLERHSGAMVYVMGQVRTGGAFSIAKPVTLTQALALAGGHNNEADLTSVLVFRRQGQQFGARRLDLEKTLGLDEDGTLFYLQPDDIVYIPRRGRAQWAEVMREVSEIIFFRGWSSGLDGPLFVNPIIK
ncbi:polysaccharide export outer membrane protein [Desulfobaculum xiamenense]|uniref:Polysaccharide export outer membrane protein n=1 Tax=Desulfobaculum xiamenense TaxID=995050 RepID=A0A846QN11_9BACT|nr:polysaccharide biosynthesis/export family protein [Desulfobaculum xiamenense]NJB67643.1 polysaccharide export outer membrane protein [Desulfobaculum xiamenense]